MPLNYIDPWEGRVPSLRGQSNQPQSADVEKNKGIFGDLVDTFQQGFTQSFAGDAEAVGQVAGSDTFENIGKALTQIANSQSATMTDDAQQALSQHIFKEDPESITGVAFDDGATNWRTWALQFGVLGGQVAGTMATGFGAGTVVKLGAKQAIKAVAKKAVTKEAQQLVAKNAVKEAIRNGALDDVRTALIAAPDKAAMNAVLNKATSRLGGIATTAVAGSMAAGMRAQQARDEYLGLDADTLNQNPEFQKAYWDIADNPENQGLDTATIHNAAKEMLAEKAATTAFFDKKALLSDLASGAYVPGAGGVIGRGAATASKMGRFGIGLAKEGAPEAWQGGETQRAVNEAIKEWGDESRDPMAGVLSTRFEEGVLGGVFGGAVKSVEGPDTHTKPIITVEKPALTGNSMLDGALAQSNADEQSRYDTLTGHVDELSKPAYMRNGDISPALENAIAQFRLDAMQQQQAQQRKDGIMQPFDNPVTGNPDEPAFLRSRSFNPTGRDVSGSPDVDPNTPVQQALARSVSEDQSVESQLAATIAKGDQGKTPQEDFVTGEWLRWDQRQPMSEPNRIESGVTMPGESREILPESRGLPYNQVINMGGTPGDGVNNNYVPPVTADRVTADQSLGQETIIDPRSPVGQAIESAGNQYETLFSELKNVRVTKRGKPFSSEKEAQLASRATETPIALLDGGFGVVDKAELAQAQERVRAEVFPNSRENPQALAGKYGDGVINLAAYNITNADPLNKNDSPLSVEDAQFELDVMQDRANKGKLTPESFTQSGIASRLDTSQIKSFNDQIKSGDYSFIKALKVRISNQSAATPSHETVTAPVVATDSQPTPAPTTTEPTTTTVAETTNQPTPITTQSDGDMRGLSYAIVGKNGEIKTSGSIPSLGDPKHETSQLDYYRALADKMGGDLYFGETEAAPMKGNGPLIMGKTWQEIQAMQQGKPIQKSVTSKMPKNAVLVHSSTANNQAPVRTDLSQDTPDTELETPTAAGIDGEQRPVNKRKVANTLKPAQKISEAELKDRDLLKEHGGKWKYRYAVGANWQTANTKESAIERATEAHSKAIANGDLVPTRDERFDQANKDIIDRMDQRYGKMSVPELEKEHARLGGVVSALQKAGKNEFNGNGGRRTGAATSNEGARDAGLEKMRLEGYIQARKERESTAGNNENSQGIIENSLANYPETTAIKPEKTIEDHFKDLSKYQSGEMDFDEFKQAASDFLDNEESVKAKLAMLTKPEILKRMGPMFNYNHKGDKKDVIVDAAYQSLAGQLRFAAQGDKDVITETVSFEEIQGKRARKTTASKAREEIAALTSEKYGIYQEKAKAATKKAEERFQKVKQQITDPQTLDDFETFLNYRSIDKLTPEQKARYEDLKAERNLDKRDQAAAAAKETKVVPTATGDIVKTKHTKEGYDLFVVKLADRVDRDAYTTINAKAKELGGYYSKFRGNGAIPGFQFRTEEQAKEFQQWLSNTGNESPAVTDVKATTDITAEPEVTSEESSKKKQADKLRDRAASVREKAQAELNADRKSNTAKRAREASYAIARAEADLNFANMLDVIANGIEAGEIKYLRNMTAGTQLETLNRVLRRIIYGNKMNEAIRNDLIQKGYLHKNDNSELSWTENAPVEVITQYADMPGMDYSANILRDTAKNMQTTAGFKQAGVKIMNQALMAINAENRMVTISDPDLIDKLKQFSKQHEVRDYLKDTMADYDRLVRMGITSPIELRAALRELHKVKQSLKGTQPKRDPVKQKEDALKMRLLNNRNAFVDFFPTPDEHANDVIARAGIEPGMRVLEPSAGHGALAVAARDAGATVDAVELSNDLRDILTEKGFNLVGSDFMETEPAGEYDAVVMNPPFSSDMDIDHVKHAYAHLKPGGRLVAIVSSMAGERSNNKNKQFKEWLNSLGATEEMMPEGSFKNSMNPTSVRTKIIELQKPSDSKNVKNQPMGSRVTIHTPKGKPVEVQYQLVSAADLVASNEFDGRVNKSYPQELQPRDRTKASYQQQVNQIAANPEGSRLAGSPESDRGAPIVRDLVVESGNGRTIGIKQAYKQGTANEYRDYLIKHADEFGFTSDDVNMIDDPVLVRQRVSDLSPEERLDFVVDSNTDAKMANSATEDAKSDARYLDNGMMDLLNIPEGGDLLAASNERFLSAFATKLGSNSLNNYKDSSGRWNESFRKRVSNAIFAYGYDNDTLLKSATGDTSEAGKNLTSALMNNAASVAELRSMVPETAKAFVNYLAEGIDVMTSAKRNGQSIQEVVNQGDMLSGGVSHYGGAIAEMLSDASRSGKRLTETLNQITGMLNESAKSADQMDLLTGEPTQQVTAEEAINAAEKDFNKRKDQEQRVRPSQDLFGANPARIRDNNGSGTSVSRPVSASETKSAGENRRLNIADSIKDGMDASRQNDAEAAGVENGDSTSNIPEFKSKSADDSGKSGISKEEVDRVVEEFKREYKGNIPPEIITKQTQEEAYGPEATVERYGKIEGGYLPAGNQLHIIADNISTKRDRISGNPPLSSQRPLQHADAIRRVLRHEIFGHYGLNTFSPEEKRSLIGKIKNTRNDAALGKTWAYVDKNYAEKSESKKAEEVFAHIAEEKHDFVSDAWNRVLSYLHGMMRRAGLLNKDVTIHEIREYARSIAKGIKSGDREQKTFPVDNESQYRKSEPENTTETADKGGFSLSKMHSNEAEKSGKGMTKPEVELAAREWLKQFKTDINVVVAKDGEDFYKKYYEAKPNGELEDGMEYSGLYIPNLKTVIVNASSINTPKELRQLLRHEILVHHGLRYVIGGDYFNEIIETLHRGMETSKRIADAFDKVSKSYSNDSYEEKMEEVFAHYAENSPADRGPLGRLWERIVGMVKSAFVKVGFITENESERELDLLLKLIAKEMRDGTVAVSPSYGNVNGELFSKTMAADDELMTKLGLGPKPNLAEKTKSQIDALKQTDRNTVKAWIKKVGRQANTQILDALAPIKYAEESAGSFDATNSAYVAARLSSGSASVMQATMLYGLPEWKDGVVQRKDGTTDKDSLLGIFSDLGSDLHNWLAWMAGHRAEILMAEGRENLLSAADITKLKLKGAGKEAKFNEAKKKWNKLNGAVLDMAQEAGLIKAEERANWESEWYIPFFRETDDGDVTAPFKKNGIANQSSGIKKLKGGTANVNDLLENIFTTTGKLIDASMKNMAAQKLVHNLADTDLISIIDKPNLMDLKAAFKNQGNKMTVRVDGEDHVIQVSDPDLFKAMTMIDMKVDRDPFRKLAMKAKHLITAGVTASPDFMLRNFLRDAASSWAINEDGFKPMIDSIRGVKKAWKMDDSSINMMFSGASFMGGNVRGNDPTAMATTVRKVLKRKGMSPEQINEYESSLITTGIKAKEVIGHYWEKYEQAGEAVENGSREAVYEAAIKAGKSHAQAAFEAKDLMDFSMLGSSKIMRYMVDVLPFFNARMQGLGKLGRAMAANPKQIAKRGGMIAAASLALLAMNWDDERYNDLPDWDKDMNWHFWFGDQHFRIPKPFEVGLMFGTLPERMVRAIGGKDSAGKFGEVVARNMLETFSINPIPQVVKPLTEVYFNYDMFRGAPVEDMSDLNVNPEARYDEKTSLLMRELGDMTGMSPKKLEHVVLGYTGTMGGYVMAMGDGLVRMMGDYGDAPAIQASQIPMLKAIYQGDGPAKSSQAMTDFYQLLDESNQIYATIRQYNKEGRTDDARELLDENRTKLAGRKSMSHAQKQFTALRNEITLIQRDRILNSDEKRQRIDKLLAQRNNMAAKLMQRFGAEL